MTTSTCADRNVLTRQSYEPVVLVSCVGGENEKWLGPPIHFHPDDGSWKQCETYSLLEVSDLGMEGCEGYGSWHESWHESGGAHVELLITALPQWLSEPWWRSCSFSILEQRPIVRKYKAKKVAQVAQTPEQIWGQFVMVESEGSWQLLL